MPRSKAFSPDVAMGQITDTFTARGYEGTSISDLERACGVAKQSLYNTFGDKRSMYLQALDCAVAQWAPVGLRMQRAATGHAALTAFFSQLLALCTSDSEAEQNCIVSAGLLEGIDDADVREHLQAKWQSTRELLLAAVRRGQSDGSLHALWPAADAADHLMTLMSGLRVTARAGAEPARLKRIVRHHLWLLTQPPP